MQDVYSVLREKETAIERVCREIEALRLVCNLMESEKDSRADSIRITLESSTESEEKTHVVTPANKRKPLQQIGTRLVEGPRKEIKKEDARSVLLQCRQAAVNASQTFLRRVRDSRLLERDPHRNSIREFLDRFGRAA